MHDLALPRIIGHRGARATAPENTLAGLRQAHAEGATWVEFDVKLSADDQPILIHDETLNRTTNGRGKVRGHTLAQIRKLDAGGWMAARFRGERIPTLAEALEQLAQLDMGFNAEIKPWPRSETRTAEIAVACIRKNWPRSRPLPIISCFQPQALEAARAAAPELPRGYLAEVLPRNWLDEVRRLDCATVHPRWWRLRRKQIDAIRAAGYPVLIWTVNNIARARKYLEWGVASVITDRPAALVAGTSVTRSL
jgi:glycerophosphoryl diester phosphodiesterase